MLNQSTSFANTASLSTHLVSSTPSAATNQAQYDKIPMLSIATSDNLLKFKEAIRDISPDLAYAKIDPTQRIVIGLLLSNNPPNFIGIPYTEVECLQWHENPHMTKQVIDLLASMNGGQEITDKMIKGLLLA